MSIASTQWPVDITDKCVELCAKAMQFDTQREARTWLLELIANGGDIVDQLPEPLTGRRSPSGYFFLVKDTVALPLVNLIAEQRKWLATSFLMFPQDQPDAALDPFSLSTQEVLRQLAVSRHAAERFQQRCGGPTNLERGRRELIKRIAPTARIAHRPPAWCQTQPADFYLIAGARDEYCLPCGQGAGEKPFEVITCIHRAGDYFAYNPYDPTRLAALCRAEPTIFPPGGWRTRLLTEAFHFSGQLKWDMPTWADYHPGANWWIVFRERVAVPVAWQPDNEETPLLILDLVDKRPLILRLFSRLRH